MSPIFPELPRTLGVYTLTHLLETRENTELYLARQTHVDRAVVLEVLQPDAPHAEEVAFLSKARHLVTTHDVPHVVDVLESLRAEGIWFLTQECPQGCSLDDMAARNIKLPVMSICRVVSAAAEMYETYLEAGHHAMPLAPASVYVEESGEVHFLSPLAEGIPNKPRRQMRALARALKAVCPVIQTPGLGRVTTLLHWLREGVDGEFLTWPEVKETAETIIDQLENNTLPESRKSFLTRLGERIGRLPGARCVQAFMGEWGSRLAAAAATIVLLSRLEHVIMRRARNINLFVQFESMDDIGTIVAVLRRREIRIFSVEIHKAKESQDSTGALFALRLPQRMSHTALIAELAGVENVRSIEEL